MLKFTLKVTESERIRSALIGDNAYVYDARFRDKGLEVKLRWFEHVQQYHVS